MESTQEKRIQYNPKICPICSSATFMIHHMEHNKERSDYWHCKCGVVFQEKFPLGDSLKHEDVYKAEYVDNYLGLGQKYIDMCHYPVRVYAPIIEELTYGRKMLEVGFISHFFMQEMSKRGWLTWGIDVIGGTDDNDRIYKGDFESYDFKGLKFNLIWLSHVFEHFKDPKAVLKKCYDLLAEDGVIYIATPDTDFIHTRSAAGFPHWKRDEHYIMWNKESLVKEIEKNGFDVIMARRNYEQRWVSYDDVQVLAQKRFF